MLSSAVLDRNLLKLRIQNEPIAAEEVAEKREQTARQLGLSLEDTTFLVFTGVAENSLYNPHDEKINILYKDGTVRDISQVDSPLIHQHISQPVKKFYISCNKTQKIQS
jgi:hypothetical protein